MVARGWPREIAIKEINTSDRERRAFIKYVFRVDWDAPELYDLVLNMDHLMIDLAVDAILHVARSEEIMARAVDGMRSLEMMALARRAEAALIEAGLKHGPSLSVLEPGRIRLGGLVREKSEKTKVEEILRRVKGVKSIDNEIQVSRAAEYGYG